MFVSWLQIPDLETGFEFRQAVYSYMNVTLPAKPTNKVLFWMRRPGCPRTVLNQKALVDIAERYNMLYT
jgi:hypothetical protein